MDKEKVIDRVKKLLNLANSDNENEAKLAAGNASKLLTKYNLSMQEVNVNRDYENSSVAEKPRMSQEDKWIFPLLKEFYYIHPIIKKKHTATKQYSTQKKNRNLWDQLDDFTDPFDSNYDRSQRRQFTNFIHFIGEETNVQVAVYVYEFLSKEYKVLWNSFKERTSSLKSSKESYYHGLTWGIKEQLKKSQKAAQQEYGLVLVNDAALEKFVTDLYPKLKKTSSNANVGDQAATQAGLNDGHGPLA